MTIFFGKLCIKVAFVASLIQTLGVVPHPIAKLARPACQTTALFLISAFLTLVVSLLRNDTNMLFVGIASFVEDPWYLRLTGIWNVHIGIVLLWAALLALFSSFYVILSKHKSLDFVSRPTIGIQGFMLSGFLLYMIVHHSPFELNPDQIMLHSGIVNANWHHLLFFTGYMFLSVAYALCVGVLIEGKAVSLLVLEAMPWLRFGWFSLAFGLMVTLFMGLYAGVSVVFDMQETIACLVFIAVTSLLLMLPKIEEDRIIKKAVLFIDISLFFVGIIGSLWYQKQSLKSLELAKDTASAKFIFYFLFGVLLFSLVIYVQRVVRSLRKNKPAENA